MDTVTAAGLDIGQYPFGFETPTDRCSHCGAVLDRVMPAVAFGSGWHGALSPDWLSDRLRRATLSDHEHEERP